MILLPWGSAMCSHGSDPSRQITIRGRCVVTGAEVEVPDIDFYGYTLWRDGALIQDALPTLTDDQREFLMTGIGQWEKLEWPGDRGLDRDACRGPLLMHLMEEGHIWVDGREYVGLASDGVEVHIGQFDEEDSVEEYLKRHPTPAEW